LEHFQAWTIIQQKTTTTINATSTTINATTTTINATTTTTNATTTTTNPMMKNKRNKIDIFKVGTFSSLDNNPTKNRHYNKRNKHYN
jgi:hypothetical protein